MVTSTILKGKTTDSCSAFGGKDTVSDAWFLLGRIYWGSRKVSRYASTEQLMPNRFFNLPRIEDVDFLVP